MNTKHKLLFIRSLAKNRGFALPMAMIVGLLLLGVGISMIAKSQGDTTKIATQQVKADSLNVAEVGVARVLELLQKHRRLAWYDSARWSDYDLTGEENEDAKVKVDFDKKQGQINACPGGPYTNSASDEVKIADDLATIKSLVAYDEASGETSWQPALPNQSEDGIQRYYRLVSYVYQGTTDGQITGNGTTAKLIVEGLARQGDDVESKKQSISRIEVEVEVKNERNENLIFDPSLNATNNPEIPGLWIKEGIINEYEDETTFNGWLKSRDDSSKLEINAAKFKSYVLTSERCFEPEREDETKKWADTHIFSSQERNFAATFVKEEFPLQPDPPNDLGDPIEITANMTLPEKEEDCDYNDNNDKPKCKGKKNQKIPVKNQSQENNQTDPENTPDETVYEYKVSKFELPAGQTLTITPGKKVILYVEGDIITGNTGGIEHDCSTTAMAAANATSCKPTDLQIFAYADEETPGKICLGGSKPLAAFIFAPNHALGKSGSGEFTGAMWGKSWGKIDNCTSHIDPYFTDPNNPDYTLSFVQSALWEDLYHDLRPVMPLPSLGKVVKWQQISQDIQENN